MEVYNLRINLNGKNPEFFDRFVESYGGRNAILAEFELFYTDEYDRRRANGDSEGRAYKNANEALNELLLHLAKENGFWDENITVKERYPDVNVFNFLALSMPWNIREFIHAYGGSDRLMDDFRTFGETEYARRRRRKEKRQDAKRKARELQNWMALRAARELGFLPKSCATGMTTVTETPVNATKPTAPVKTERQDNTSIDIHSTIADLKTTEMLPCHELLLAASGKESGQVQTTGSGMERYALVPTNSKNPVQTPINAMQLVSSKEAQPATSSSTWAAASEKFLCKVQSTPSTVVQLTANGKFASGDFGNDFPGFLSIEHIHSVLLTLTVTDISIRQFAIFRHANVATILAQEAAAYTLHARLSGRAPKAQTLQIQVQPLAIHLTHMSPAGNTGSEMTEPMVTMTPAGNVGRLSTQNVKASRSVDEPDAHCNLIPGHLQTSDQVHTENEGIIVPWTGMQRSTPSIPIPDLCFIRALTPVYMSAAQFVRPCVHSSYELPINQRLLRSTYINLHPGPTYSSHGERNTDGNSLQYTRCFGTNSPMTENNTIFKTYTETQDYACQTCKPTTGGDAVIEIVEKSKDTALPCTTTSEKSTTVSSRIMGFLRRWCCAGPKKTPKETEV